MVYEYEYGQIDQIYVGDENTNGIVVIVIFERAFFRSGLSVTAKPS